MTKAEKILLTLARLSGESQNAVTYEDLVVAAYETYPEDFALRGYPQYPDASDLHKPVYNLLKPSGFVKVIKKTFKITEAGLRRARELERRPGDTTPSGTRLTRGQERAFRRYASSAAVRLVAQGRESELIDTDCQRFYGFAPWTKPKEAAALRGELLSALAILEPVDNKLAELLRQTDIHLHQRFRVLLEEKPVGN